MSEEENKRRSIEKLKNLRAQITGAYKPYGITDKEPFEGHHIIPVALFSHNMACYASQAGAGKKVELNHLHHNGMPLPKTIEYSHFYNLPCHRKPGNFNHPNYNRQVQVLLDNLEDRAKREGWMYHNERIAEEIGVLIVNISLTIKAAGGGIFLNDVSL